MSDREAHFRSALQQAAREYASRASSESPPRGLLLEAITRCDLDDAVLDAEAADLTPMLRGLGIDAVIYECCDGWTPLTVERIREVLNSDLPREEFTSWVRPYGTIDQTFRSTDPLFELEFCHEAQVHARANDPALLEPFWARWKENGLAFGRRIDAEWFWEEEGNHDSGQLELRP